jgi:ABC-type tungstate transport system permease subunit
MRAHTNAHGETAVALTQQGTQTCSAAAMQTAIAALLGARSLSTVSVTVTVNPEERSSTQLTQASGTDIQVFATHVTLQCYISL